MAHRLLPRRTDFVIIDKQKRNCRILNFVLPAKHKVKIKAWE